MTNSLIQKYNVAGPRYTSYPAVPHWENNPNHETWKMVVKNSFIKSNNSEGISLYLHLPYCESLCTYCGCNMQVSKNHGVELPYVETLLQEWNLYRNLFNEKPRIKELHLGGGTPTFFSPENLSFLIENLLKNADLAPNYEFSFEAHPKNTSKKHLQVFYNLGFRRFSLGIQDFDPKVQEVINRHQPFEMVEEVVKNAREIGYTSINFDLIYGLPLQTIQSIENTISKVNLLRPERIAFYSYAHVPWDKKMQRKFTEADLPADENKRALYERGKMLFGEMGYQEIGMDHFALPEDSLFSAIQKQTLHRNFMGYTANSTRLLIGLGVSSISDTWDCFAQNHKTISAYQQAVKQGIFPIFRGHLLSKEQEINRRHILNLMCHFETSWKQEDGINKMIQQNLQHLLTMEQEGLLTLSGNTLKVSELGKIFIRNICMLIDPLLLQTPDKPVFSKTI